MKTRILLPLSFLLLGTACAPKNSAPIQQVTKDTTGAVGCENFESRAWNAVDKYLIEQKEIPSAAELKESLNNSLKDLKGPQDSVTEENLQALAAQISGLYDLLL